VAGVRAPISRGSNSLRDGTGRGRGLEAGKNEVDSSAACPNLTVIDPDRWKVRGRPGLKFSSISLFFFLEETFGFSSHALTLSAHGFCP
jgi:hypothetical protein